MNWSVIVLLLLASGFFAGAIICAVRAIRIAYKIRQRRLARGIE